jgi:predicted Rossmann-fold nucleotide-binding protein
MKLIIAGGRDYAMTFQDHAALSAINANLGVTEVVSGAASGADKGGEQWATAVGIPVKQFPADWNAHGRAAGPIRNGQMAEYADALAVFPGGRGTENMIKQAKAKGLLIFDFTTSQPT